MKRIVCVLVMTALLVMSLSGCGTLEELFKLQPEPETTAASRETVEQMVERCNAACNDMDLDGILDCVSPKIADPLRTGLDLAGKLGGQSDEELLNTLLEVLGAERAENAGEICSTLQIEVDSVEPDGDTAQAEVSFTYFQNGQKYVGKTNVSCVCIEGRWYISGLSV